MDSRFRGNDGNGGAPPNHGESEQTCQLVIRIADDMPVKIGTMTKQPAVYILTNEAFGTLYVGVTSNLPQRIWQHRHGLVAGFTREHGLHRLVWFEMHQTMYAAISREKQLKKWNRAWKIRLIRAQNPQWRNLWNEICRG